MVKKGQFCDVISVVKKRSFGWFLACFKKGQFGVVISYYFWNPAFLSPICSPPVQFLPP